MGVVGVWGRLVGFGPVWVSVAVNSAFCAIYTARRFLRCCPTASGWTVWLWWRGLPVMGQMGRGVGMASVFL